MAKETLTVKNFGPIREANLDLRRVTVLIGEQASGKSVLAKLVAILHSYGFTKSVFEIGHLNKNIKKIFRDNLGYYNILNYLKSLSSIEFEAEGYAFNFRNQEATAKHRDREILYLVRELERIAGEDFEKSKEEQVLFTKEEFEAAGRVKIERGNFWKEIEDKTFLLQQLIFETSYIPAERSAIFHTNEFHSRYMKMFEYEFKKNRRLKNNFSSPVIEIDFFYDDHQGENFIRLKNGEKIEVESSASGFQSFIPIQVSVETKNPYFDSFFIIEEPELNLYPTTQKKLVEYLIEKCTKGDNRLIITTHSPYILTALNNCIQARNTLREHPEHAGEVAKLVRPESQIDYEDVMAYFVADGTAKPIMNDENRLIDANALDDVSNELGEIFDRLLDLEMQPA